MNSNELRIGNYIAPINNDVLNSNTIVLGIFEANVFVPFEGVPKKFPLELFLMKTCW